MTLENTDDGVVWKVEFWAAKVGDPAKESEHRLCMDFLIR